VEIVTNTGGKRLTAVGRAIRVNGRAATISLQTAFQGISIDSVTTIGREARTYAEVMRGDVVMKALQLASDIMGNPFVRRVFLSDEIAPWVGIPFPAAPITLYLPGPRALNSSQKKAVNVILSQHDANRVTLIHGPPGTGKTTVITAAVTSVMASRHQSHTLWLIAQSNVAVKNIAEKLAEVDFTHFKLLVSKDFHYDWSGGLLPSIYNMLKGPAGMSTSMRGSFIMSYVRMISTIL